MYSWSSNTLKKYCNFFMIDFMLPYSKKNFIEKLAIKLRYTRQRPKRNGAIQNDPHQHIFADIVHVIARCPGKKTFEIREALMVGILKKFVRDRKQEQFKAVVTFGKGYHFEYINDAFFRIMFEVNNDVQKLYYDITFTVERCYAIQNVE